MSKMTAMYQPDTHDGLSSGARSTDSPLDYSELEHIGVVHNGGKRYGWMRHLAAEMGVDESTMRRWKARPEAVGLAERRHLRRLAAANVGHSSPEQLSTRDAWLLCEQLRDRGVALTVSEGPHGLEASLSDSDQVFQEANGWAGLRAHMEKQGRVG